MAAGDPEYGTLYACLYAGPLSQAGWEAPESCGRGALITLATADELHACLYAGRLSQVSWSPPVCGRGEQTGLAVIG